MSKLRLALVVLGVSMLGGCVVHPYYAEPGYYGGGAYYSGGYHRDHRRYGYRRGYDRYDRYDSGRYYAPYYGGAN